MIEDIEVLQPFWRILQLNRVAMKKGISVRYTLLLYAYVFNMKQAGCPNSACAYCETLSVCIV